MVKYVLDACALIALMNKEEGWRHVAELYKTAVAGEAELIMNKINLFEVYYGYLKEDGELFAGQRLDEIEKSIVKINDVISSDIFYHAGKVKSSYRRISVADSFAVAQAVVSNAVLVTADHHELDVVDKSGIVNFLWIR
ncbi:MAG: PIN domain-containing protein [Oscillospiraceae bacterium]|nr:PIN domain-containing protein [Oscillospiraceae bacterium]